MHFNSRPVVDRFAAKIALTDSGCIEWIAHRDDKGYGRIWLNGKNVGAHRWSYEYHVGPIREGLHIDHLCRNPPCVNPAHLEPVTPQENVRRGIGPTLVAERAAARWDALTHCSEGHELTVENIYTNPHGTHECLACRRARRKEHYRLNRQRYIEKAAEWRLANLDRSREHARNSTRRSRAKKKEEADA